MLLTRLPGGDGKCVWFDPLIAALEEQGDGADSELEADADLDGELARVVGHPDVEVGGAAEEDVVEEEELVTDRFERAGGRLNLFPLLGFDARHNGFFAV